MAPSRAVPIGRAVANMQLYILDQLGQPRLALKQIEAAVKRDPEDWRLRYVLAVNRALLGRDPRAEMRRARELDPLERLPELGVARFASAGTPKAWQRRAQRARLPGI